MTNVSDPIAIFADSAREFCLLIERHKKVTRKSFLRKVALILPQLYAHAIGLPKESSYGSVKALRLSNDEWQKLFMSLGRKLGRVAIYWECFNPYVKEELVAGNLADDLADIYRDIKPGLTAYDGGGKRSKEVAGSEWRLGMMNHWGHHATGAPRALHQLQSEWRLTED